MIKSLPFKQATNVLLRVSSLAAKLLLTLYMGRYLGLSELGVYGLVFSAVMIATGVLGSRLDYVVTRDLVSASPVDAARRMRDQTVFYAIHYVLFALVMLAAWGLSIAPPLMLLSVFVITVLEHLANSFTTNLVSLGHPVLSTFLFFVRAGLWCVVVVLLGLLFPVTRTVESVMIGWAFGGGLGVLMGAWVLRKKPWKEALQLPVDWAWIKKAVMKSFPIWIGTIGAMMASGVDRFVVSYYLDMESVGIITFYGSFAAALLSLVHSGFFSFSYPRLIAFHQSGEGAAFWSELRQTGLQVAAFVFLASAALGVVLPYAAYYLDKPELAAQAYTLWLILGAVWIRANADTFYFALYAQHRDRPLWLGDLIYLLLLGLGCVVLVPVAGLPGAGYSAIIASALLCGWWYRAAVAKAS